ncbi:MAG: zf-HC2 domain-containing protein [Burkholderiaceae bacterium]
MGVKVTCKEVHRLVSEELDRDLSLMDRVRVHLHLLACDACKNFDGQMRLLRRAMRRLTVPDAADDKREPK